MSQHQSRRIDDVMTMLKAAWLKHPELRLGQLIVNVLGPTDSCPEIFHAGDQYLFGRLRALCGEMHMTPVWANIFEDLGFPKDEAEALLAESNQTILAKMESVPPSARQPDPVEYEIGRTVWIAEGTKELVQGEIVHKFRLSDDQAMNYVIRVETVIEPR